MKNKEMKEEDYLPRTIKLIVIHCSATRCNVPFTPAQLEKRFRTQGYKSTGYHFYITRDGMVHHTRPVDRPGVHTPGFNLHSIGICYEGGLDETGNPCDTRTTFQRMALLDIISILKKQYPGVVVKGSDRFRPETGETAALGFDAEWEYEEAV